MRGANVPLVAINRDELRKPRVPKPEPESSRVSTLKLRPLPLCPDPIKALRSLLKIALRRFELRCVDCIEETTHAKEDKP
jgi:hypothetical protein